MARSVAYYQLSEKTLSGEDELIGIFRSKEISGITGCSARTVSAYADSVSRYKGRWRFKRVDVADWAEEWDKVRMEIFE